MSEAVLEKPKLIILEGCDKSGKSALYQEYRRATGYKPLVIDRFIGSNICHDKFYQREGRSSYNLHLYLNEVDLEKIFDVYLVVLTADKRVLEARIRVAETGKDRDIALSNYVAMDGIFHSYYRTSMYKKKLLLDTSSEPLEQTLDRLLEFTKEVDIRCITSK